MTSFGRAFAIVIQLLVIASLLGFSIETLPHLIAKTRGWLRSLEIITVSIFSGGISFATLGRREPVEVCYQFLWDHRPVGRTPRFISLPVRIVVASGSFVFCDCFGC